MNPLVEAPYSMLPKDMHIIVLLHGTELVTVAKKNEAQYEDVVQHMRYHANHACEVQSLWLGAERLWLPDGRHAAFCRGDTIRHDRAGALAKPGLCAGQPGGDRQKSGHENLPIIIQKISILKFI